MNWTNEIAVKTEGEVVAIDGKTSRGSRDAKNGKSPLHLVSAWACANRLVLGQEATAEKSNEITAIPKLLSLLELKGCIVTLDAMGCQTDIAAQIIGKGAITRLGLRAIKVRCTKRWRIFLPLPKLRVSRALNRITRKRLTRGMAAWKSAVTGFARM